MANEKDAGGRRQFMYRTKNEEPTLNKLPPPRAPAQALPFTVEERERERDGAQEWVLGSADGGGSAERHTTGLLQLKRDHSVSKATPGVHCPPRQQRQILL